jgi:hypothetical protein
VRPTSGTLRSATGNPKTAENRLPKVKAGLFVENGGFWRQSSYIAALQDSDVQKIRRLIHWLSSALATLVALFIVAVALPNTDRVVVGPAGAHMEPQPWVVLYILTTAFLPVLCILILERRWIFFDWLGWIILGLGLAGIFAG